MVRAGRSGLTYAIGVSARHCLAKRTDRGRSWRSGAHIARSSGRDYICMSVSILRIGSPDFEVLTVHKVDTATHDRTGPAIGRGRRATCHRTDRFAGYNIGRHDASRTCIRPSLICTSKAALGPRVGALHRGAHGRRHRACWLWSFPVEGVDNLTCIWPSRSGCDGTHYAVVSVTQLRRRGLVCSGHRSGIVGRV
jgi:hypothetical protein